MSDDMREGWSGETRWLSNDGKGPLMARCVGETGDVFTLEIWNTRSKSKRPRRRRITITARVLAMTSCGWTRVKP